MTDWSSLKVVELRAALSSRGLPTKGVKAELIQRLNDADADAAAQSEEPATEDSATVDETDRTADDVPIQEEAAAELKMVGPSPAIDAIAPVNEDAITQPSVAASPKLVAKDAVAAHPETSDEAVLPTPIPSSDAAAEIQKRKRRSSTPPPSAKRARQEEERQAEQREDIVDFDTGDLSSSPQKRPQNGVAAQEGPTEIAKSEDDGRHLGGSVADNTQDLSEVSGEETSAEQAAMEELSKAPSPASAPGAQGLSPDVKDQAYAKTVDTAEPPRPAPVASVSQEQAAPLDISGEEAVTKRVAIEEPSGTPQTTVESQERQHEDRLIETTQPADQLPEDDPQARSVGSSSMPSIHPPTTSLYIRELMRPLRPEMVEQHIVNLMTPPGSEPDQNLIEESYLDTIRTHAFVQLASVEAAQRVRAALHNQVWPNERNRKPLWVDFIPSGQIKDFIEREETAPRGGRRWEVVYEQEGGSVVAIHREVGSDNKTFSKPPPTGPAAGPTYPGIEAAPRGPRGRGGRPPFEAPGGPQSQQTNAQPRLFYTPLNEDVAQRRIENMRSFYSRDPPPNLGKDYHRFTFENLDSFVDRGREVFIGIRPPHRQKEHEERLQRERLGTAGTNSMTDSRRSDYRPPRPPVTDESRFSRYDGGRRADRPPRNRGFRGDRGPGRFRGDDPYRYRPGY